MIIDFKNKNNLSVKAFVKVFLKDQIDFFKIYLLFIFFMLIIIAVIYFGIRGLRAENTDWVLISTNIMLFGITVYYAYATQKILRSNEKERKSKRIQEITKYFLYPLLMQVRNCRERIEKNSFVYLAENGYNSEIVLQIDNNSQIKSLFDKNMKTLVLNPKFNDFWFKVFFKDLENEINCFESKIQKYRDFAVKAVITIIPHIDTIYKNIDTSNVYSWKIPSHDNILSNIQIRNLFSIIFYKKRLDGVDFYDNNFESQIYLEIITDLEKMCESDSLIRDTITDLHKMEKDILDLLNDIENIIINWFKEWEKDYYISLNN